MSATNTATATLKNVYAIVDELAQVRDDIRALEDRERFLKNEILNTKLDTLYGEGSVAHVIHSKRNAVSAKLAKELLPPELLAAVTAESSVVTIKVTALDRGDE